MDTGKYSAIFRVAVSLFVCGAAARGFQASQDSTVSAEKDVYIIYSLMLSKPPTSHGPDTDERYLIADLTAPPYPREPCVRPPQEREQDFKDVLADFERRKSKPRELKPLFSIRKPYLLLNAREVSAFRSDRFLRHDKRDPDDRFRGATDVFTLSDVYFNQQHTLALTGISSWCGGLCGLSLWKVFEKVDADKWEERRWVTCSTIAGGRPGIDQWIAVQRSIRYGP